MNIKGAFLGGLLGSLISIFAIISLLDISSRLGLSDYRHVGDTLSIFRISVPFWFIPLYIALLAAVQNLLFSKWNGFTSLGITSLLSGALLAYILIDRFELGKSLDYSVPFIYGGAVVLVLVSLFLSERFIKHRFS